MFVPESIYVGRSDFRNRNISLQMDVYSSQNIFRKCRFNSIAKSHELLKYVLPMKNDKRGHPMYLLSQSWCHLTNVLPCAGSINNVCF